MVLLVSYRLPAVYPGGALGNTSSCGKALMELYEWGWIKKIPRIAVINAKGARTLDVLYNREDEPLRWNKGRPNEDAIVEYYDKLDKTGSRPNTKATAIQIGRPTTDMPSSISESLTVVTTPLVYSKARNAFMIFAGLPICIAVAFVFGLEPVLSSLS